MSIEDSEVEDRLVDRIAETAHVLRVNIQLGNNVDGCRAELVSAWNDWRKLIRDRVIAAVKK
jgi:hypothetical protein